MAALSLSRQLTLALAGTVLAALGTANAAQALTLVTDRAALGANESVDWRVLNPTGSFISIPSPFSVTGSGGTQVTGSLPDVPNSFFTGINQGDNQGGFAGNFAPGTALLLNQNRNPNETFGTMTFAFSNAVRGIGTQIQVNRFGPFTAFIEAFDSSGNSLGRFSRNGISDDSADNSAIFIGLLSDQLDIARVTLSTDPTNNFAINQLSLNSSATAIPTPALLPGLIGMGIATFRKRKGEAAQESSEA